MKKVIREIVEEVLADDATLFLVDIVMKGYKNNQKLLIFIDGDNGLNIDQCARISRQVGIILEEKKVFDGKYLLEVSSPGLDHPIKLRRQYIKNKGKRLSIETDTEKLEGELKEVAEDFLTLLVNGEEKKIISEKIKMSRVVVAFK